MMTIRTQAQATNLYQALEHLGHVAEFLSANDFDVSLDTLEEARVLIRRVANDITMHLPDRPIGP